MRPRFILALSNFFAVAHFYLIVYILTPFLATLVADVAAGLAVALGAIVTLTVFPQLPKLIARHGPQKLAIIFAGIEGILLLLLSTYPSPLVAVLLVALCCAIPPLIVYQLDLLLEACVGDESSTGRVRTAFMTTGNLALILSPILVAVLLDGTDRYGLVFMVAALSVIPFILLMLTRSLPQIQLPRQQGLRKVGSAIFADRDQRAVALSYLILQFFYHAFSLYLPLYLHTVLGLPWSTLGFVLAITLIPFVLLEYPAGWLADTKFGDKTLLAAGFVITGLAFASFAFVTAATPLITIVVLLLAMRIGAVFVEAMTESHFFRRISSADVEAVSVFRMMRPLGALITPIVGTILLSAGTYGGLFVISGFAIVGTGIACAYVISGRVIPKPEMVPKALRPCISKPRC